MPRDKRNARPRAVRAASLGGGIGALLGLARATLRDGSKPDKPKPGPKPKPDPKKPDPKKPDPKKPDPKKPKPVSCTNCMITQYNGVMFPPTKRSVMDTVSEARAQYTATVTPSKEHCPCKWSLVAFEYILVAIGIGALVKRADLTGLQLYVRDVMDPADPNNPYFAVANCTLTVNVSRLNRDLRAGINVLFGAQLGFQGVLTRVEVEVRCNGRANRKKIVLDIVDA